MFLAVLVNESATTYSENLLPSGLSSYEIAPGASRNCTPGHAYGTIGPGISPDLPSFYLQALSSRAFHLALCKRQGAPFC